MVPRIQRARARRINRARQLGSSVHRWIPATGRRDARRRRRRHGIHPGARGHPPRRQEVHRRGDQPACRRVGGGRHLPRPRALQEDGRPGLSRHQQAGQVRRHGARLLLPARVPRDARPHPLPAACRWRSACRPTWRRRRSPASARRSCARSSSCPRSRATTSPASACPRSAPAPTSPPSRPRRSKDGGDYVINGGKMWTTSGTQADWMCLLANTGDGPAHKNKSLICLPMKTKGVQIARKLDKLGMRSSDTAQIFFEDVRVPQRYLHRQGGRGLHLPDAAVPGGAAVRGRRRPDRQGAHDRGHHRLHRPAQGLRPVDPRQPGRALPAGGAQDRGGDAARAHLSRRRADARGART